MFLSKISLNCYLTTRRHIPKDSVLAIKCYDKNTVYASHLPMRHACLSDPTLLCLITLITCISNEECDI